MPFLEINMRIFKKILPKILFLVIFMTLLLIVITSSYSTATFRSFVRETVEKDLAVTSRDIRNEIDLLKSDPAYIVGTCRGLPQAIDLNEIRSNACDTMVMEVYYTLCKGKTIDGVKTVPLFISPFSKAGLDAVSEDDIIKEMLTRQLWRAVYLGEKTVAIEDIILRAKDAPKEIAVLKKTADHIIECPGEDACEWNRYANGIFRAAPTGKAAKALAQLAGIINMEGR